MPVVEFHRRTLGPDLARVVDQVVGTNGTLGVGRHGGRKIGLRVGPALLVQCLPLQRVLQALDLPDATFTDVLVLVQARLCLLYTSPSPRDGLLSRMPSSA
mgnify:CR=1 FL=1